MKDRYIQILARLAALDRRTQILAGLAVLGLVVALVFAFTGGGAPDVVKPLRAASAGASPAPASSSAAGNPRSGYDAYRFFHTRNVFDPDRRPLRAVSNDAPASTPAPTRTDFVALTGVMVKADRSLAFFSGSRADYNKVLAVRDRIAGVEITQILPTGIEIDRAGQKTQVSVGQTVPLSGGAAPATAPAPDAYASAPSTSSAAATGAPTSGSNNNAASPAGPSSSKQDEIRRRLEERRRQEQK